MPWNLTYLLYVRGLGDNKTIIQENILEKDKLREANNN